MSAAQLVIAFQGAFGACTPRAPGPRRARERASGALAKLQRKELARVCSPAIQLRLPPISLLIPAPGVCPPRKNSPPPSPATLTPPDPLAATPREVANSWALERAGSELARREGVVFWGRVLGQGPISGRAEVRRRLVHARGLNLEASACPLSRCIPLAVHALRRPPSISLRWPGLARAWRKGSFGSTLCSLRSLVGFSCELGVG